MIQFPINPILNQEYSYESKTWIWDGVSWNLKPFQETDPIFNASQAKNITAANISVLNNTSGTNTGDQDLSGLVEKIDNHSLVPDTEINKLAEYPEFPEVPEGYYLADDGTFKVLPDFVTDSEMIDYVGSEIAAGSVVIKEYVDQQDVLKVDKVDGKGLSTEDYTTAEKSKVANVPLNTNTELAAKVDKVAGKSLIADTEITRLASVTNQTLSGLGGEPAANKQDSLAVDGTGTKFTTVDAVNLGLATKPEKTTQVVAGAGLTGGGTLESDRTLNVESANDGITVNADNIQLNAVDNLASTSSTQPLSANQGKVLDAAKVDKVDGKGLSTNDYTVAEKDKLTAIQDGAQVNILEGVQRNGANLTITGKKVNVIVPTTPSEVGAEPANINIQSHISSTSNPHSVTKAQVGLGNVDNTSDVNKPISSATQTALNGKQPTGTYSTDIHANITALNAVQGVNHGDQTDITGNAGTATKLQTSRTINGVAFNGTQNITINAVDATSRVASSLLGASNGVATLDANGIILTTQLPSYIDDVLEYTNLAAFPVAGETGKIYVAKDTNKTYRWSGSVYTYITSGAVDSVNGLTGVVSLSKSDIGLSNVDNTSDVNKPVSTAMQSALNGKQASGTYSTDIHSNITALNATSGTNTGDETLSSIKTKLGAATAISDGYLKYQDWSIFNSKEPAITKNSGFNLPLGTTPGTVLEGRTFGTAAGSAVGDFIQNQNASAQNANMWISGINRSGSQIIGVNVTAINYPSRWGNGINEGFLDLNTGGAAIGSSTGYLQLYSSGGRALQLNVDKSAAFDSTVNSTGFLLNGNNLTSSLTTNYIPKWNGSSFVNSVMSDDGIHYIYVSRVGYGGIKLNSSIGDNAILFENNTLSDWTFGTKQGDNTQNLSIYNQGTASRALYIDKASNAATFASTINATGYLLNGNNLFSSLSTNYIPKWNGSSFVNSLVNEYNDNVGLGVVPSDGSDTQNFELQNGSVISSRLNVPQLYISSNAVGTAYSPTRKTDGYAAQMVMQGFDGGFAFNTAATGSAGSSITWVARMRINNVGNVTILSTKPSSAPTNGALLVEGGIGADHVTAKYFSGSGSNLTGIQRPITLTTNGTSGPATFSGDVHGSVLNVPNYGSIVVHQTQTTVDGLASGNMVCSMPFQTGSYKKVIIYLNELVGTAEYILPVPFVGGLSRRIVSTYVSSGTFGSYLDDRVNITATNGTGIITIEGY